MKECPTIRKPGEREDDFIDREQLAARMSQIKHKIVVLSGKGGVGKSTVAANLAVALSNQGFQVGLLDIDIHGPSIPRLLNLENERIDSSSNGLLPVQFSLTLKVISIGFMLNERHDPVIWRGPMKYGIIKQFLKDVEWGILDYLIIDSPPGTGDEPLSICQLIENADGAVIVTTPQEISLLDVRKSIMFCKQLHFPVLGVIENMSGFVCPKCGESTNIFPSGGTVSMTQQMHVPFLGSIPIDPAIAFSCDNGTPFLSNFKGSSTAKALEAVIQKIISSEDTTQTHNEKEKSIMRIAIPTAEGKLAMHFGHCEQFAIMNIDPVKKEIIDTTMLTPPPHEPGVLPKWLAEQGATVIIAGGMGMRAQNLFTENNIKVIVGASAESPESVAQAYLDGSLEVGENVCDH